MALVETDHISVLGGWRALHRSDLSSHISFHGTLPSPTASDRGWAQRLIGAVEASGLTGRGGASFPSATKLKLLSAQHRRPTVVVNAMEGEPASEKDKVLLTCAPHLVLDGASLVATALQAARIVICMPNAHHDAATSMRRAIDERTRAGVDSAPFELAHPPARYLAGEESALVSWMNGRSGIPVFRLDKSVPLHIGRQPAIVHNAETLAHVALIARHGPEWFRSAGIGEAAGTCLVTVSGAVTYKGVFEVALGTVVSDIVQRTVPTHPVGAVLLGGYGGTWVSPAALATPYAPGPLAEAGAAIGAGVIVVLPAAACGIAETARIAHYMAGESAGQCGPCVYGLGAIVRDLTRLADGHDAHNVLASLTHRFGEVAGRGACRHPDGVVRLVMSALSVFHDDAVAHAAGRPCAYRDAQWTAAPRQVA